MSFSGADVDGLDRVAAECRKAAQVCDEVRMVCEAIVAAASFFGPFGAAFIAYLKGVVIPWLTRISQALTLFAKVLSAHSLAQRDASSAATSLPSYSTPAALPAGSTGDYPVLSLSAGPAHAPVAASATATSVPRTPAAAATDEYLFGLISVRHDAAGAVRDVAVAEPGIFSSQTSHLHIDRDAAGNIDSITATSQASAFGGLVSAHSQAEITPQYDSDGDLTGISAHGTGQLEVGDSTVARSADAGRMNIGYGSTPLIPNVQGDYVAEINFSGASAATAQLPGAVQTPGGVQVPGGAPPADGVTLQPSQVTIGASAWAGPDIGVGVAGSLHAHTDQLSAGLSAGGPSGLSGGYAQSAGAGVDAQAFGGTYQPGTFAEGTFTPGEGSHEVSGVLLGADAQAGASVSATLAYHGSEGGGYVTGSAGEGPGVGAGAYYLQRGDGIYAGAHGGVAEFGIGAGSYVRADGTPASEGSPEQ